MSFRSTCTLFQIAYEGDFLYVCTVTFWQEVDFLISNASVLLTVEWFKTPVSSQTQKLVAATKFSDYLGLNHYKKAKKLKHFIHLRLANWPQSFAT